MFIRWTAAAVVAGPFVLPTILEGCTSQAPSTHVPASTSATRNATLEFWYLSLGTAMHEAIAQQIQKFEAANPGVKVNINEQPVQLLRDKALPLFTNGGGVVDVMMDGAVQTLTYAQMPYGFADLTGQINSTQLRQTIPATAWAPLTSGGKTYAVPINGLVFFLVYNKHLYESVGMSSSPATWNELLTVTQQLLDPAHDRYGFLTLTDKFVTWLLETLWFDSGVGYFEGSQDWTNFDTSKPFTLSTPPAVAALEYWKSLAATAPGGVQGNIGIADAAMNAEFAKGNIGSIFSLSGELGQITSANANMKPGQDFDVVVFPKGPQRRGTEFTTHMLGVPKLSKNPDLAWKLVEFLSGQEGAIAPAIGAVPLRSDVDVDQTAAGSWLVPIGKQGLSGDAFPQAYFPQLSAVRTPLSANIQEYLLGTKSALQALQDTETAARKSIGG